MINDVYSQCCIHRVAAFTQFDLIMFVYIVFYKEYTRKYLGISLKYMRKVRVGGAA